MFKYLKGQINRLKFWVNGWLNDLLIAHVATVNLQCCQLLFNVLLAILWYSSLLHVLQINSVCCWHRFPTVRTRLTSILDPCGTLLAGPSMATRKEDALYLSAVANMAQSWISSCTSCIIIISTLTNLDVDVVLHTLWQGLFKIYPRRLQCEYVKKTYRIYHCDWIKLK